MHMFSTLGLRSSFKGLLALVVMTLGFQASFSSAYEIAETPKFVIHPVINIQIPPTTPSPANPPYVVPAGVYDLLQYLHSHVAPLANPSTDATVPKYNRLKHFGPWVVQDKTNPCHNTRENILERDSDRSVSLTFNPGGCTIAYGLWHEVYTAAEVKDASALQIDHVVPLAEVYYSGGWKWDGAKRCHYANFMGNNYHLQAVAKHENLSKGDSGPDTYMPPNHAEHCNYVAAWMRIKAIWQLNITSGELAAIEQVIQVEHCDPKLQVMDAAELAAQQALTSTPIAACSGFGTSAWVPPPHAPPGASVQ